MKGSVSLEMGNPTISGDFVFILGRDRAVTGSSRPQSCRRHSASGGRRAALDPGAAGALPVESWAGSGFISLSTIFWYKALRLKGSTVKGRVPVSMAYMFTPLEGETHQTWDRKTSQEEDRAARGVGKLGPAASVSTPALLGHSSSAQLCAETRSVKGTSESAAAASRTVVTTGFKERQNDTNDLIINRDRLRKETWGYQRGEAGGWHRSLGLTYTHSYNKGQLYSTGNATQYSVITYMGKNLKKNESMYLNNWSTLLHTWNYHNIVNQLSSNIK